MTLDAIATKLGIGHNAVQEMTGSLGFRKICARWVPRLLTEDHKVQRKSITSEMLRRYRDSLDLAPSDYRLFGFVKNQMRGQHHERTTHSRQLCVNVFGQLERSSAARGYSDFQNGGEKCVQRNGD